MKITKLIRLFYVFYLFPFLLLKYKCVHSSANAFCMCIKWKVLEHHASCCYRRLDKLANKRTDSKSDTKSDSDSDSDNVNGTVCVTGNDNDNDSDNGNNNDNDNGSNKKTKNDIGKNRSKENGDWVNKDKIILKCKIMKREKGTKKENTHFEEANSVFPSINKNKKKFQYNLENINNKRNSFDKVNYITKLRERFYSIYDVMNLNSTILTWISVHDKNYSFFLKKNKTYGIWKRVLQEVEEHAPTNGNDDDNIIVSGTDELSEKVVENGKAAVTVEEENLLILDRSTEEGKADELYNGIVNFQSKVKRNVELYHYFRGTRSLTELKSLQHGKWEVSVMLSPGLHRIVIFCFKPTIYNNSVVTAPENVPFYFLNDQNHVTELQIDSLNVLYNKRTSWGGKNLLSNGAVELIILPYVYENFDFNIVCQNKESQSLYKVQAHINVKLVINKSPHDKIYGITNDPGSEEKFTHSIKDSIDVYNLEDAVRTAVILKLFDGTLDPPECPKMVYLGEDDSQPVFLLLVFPLATFYEVEKEGSIYIIFSTNSSSTASSKYHCYFQPASGNKKKIIFGKDIGGGSSSTNIPNGKVFYVVDEKKKYLGRNYNADFEVCTFEYKTDYDVSVCERTLHEFSLFIYNCDPEETSDHQVDALEKIFVGEKITNMDALSAIPLYKEHIRLHNITSDFPDHNFFLTPYIDTGIETIGIKCSVKKKNNPADKQAAYIFIRMTADYDSNRVKVCDFTAGKQYALMNSYETGPKCVITVSKDSIFALKCPSTTKKKPAKCFSQVYIENELVDLGKKLKTKFISYSESKETVAVAAFYDYIASSYDFECYCVNKTDESDIKYTLKVRYRNYEEVQNFDMPNVLPYPSIHLGPYETHLCDFSSTHILAPMSDTPLYHVCTVHPKPLDYVALSCPVSTADKDIENKITQFTDVKEGTFDNRGNAYIKRRHRYLNFTFTPITAPQSVIDKTSRSIVDIYEKIPGVMVGKIIRTKFMYTHKNIIRWDPDLPEKSIQQRLATMKGTLGKMKKGEKTDIQEPGEKKSEVTSLQHTDPKSLRLAMSGKVLEKLNLFAEQKENREFRIVEKYATFEGEAIKPFTRATHVEEETIGIPFFDTLNQDVIDKTYDKYIGMANSLVNGFLVFQLPPYIRDNVDIQFLCDNTDTVNDNNVGNSGIMNIKLRQVGHVIDGCHYYRGVNLHSYTVLTHDINIHTEKECNIETDGDTSYIGVICSAEEKLRVEPEECLLEYFDEGQHEKRIDNEDPYFEHFSDSKGTVYLKIPPFFIKYTNIICYCETLDAELQRKKGKINIILNSSNKGIRSVKKIEPKIQYRLKIGMEFEEKEMMPITRNTTICDFTTGENTLQPTEDTTSINYCYIELKYNMSAVEILCPTKYTPVLKAAQRKTASEEEAPQAHVELEERDGEEEEEEEEKEEEEGEEGEEEEEEEEGVEAADKARKQAEAQERRKELTQRYAQIKYMPDKKDGEITHNKQKKKIEEILPGIILFNKNVPFSSSGSFKFMSPLIVKEDTTLSFYCDNSLSTYNGKVGKKGIVHVRFNKTNTEHNVEGCTFADDATPAEPHMKQYSLKNDNAICEIILKPNFVVSFKCPVGKINPNKCFEKVYVESNFGEKIEESIENIFHTNKVISIDMFGSSAVSFLFISKITGNEMNFNCTCEHTITKHVGTILVKNEERSRYARKLKDSTLYTFTDVAPLFLNNSYVCDFNKTGYSITDSKTVNLLNVHETYLNTVQNKKDEFKQFSGNLKVKKNKSRNDYLQYLLSRIAYFKKNPTDDTSDQQNVTKAYKCNVDMEAFDTFHIKCPTLASTETAQKGNLAVSYDTSMGSTEEALLGELSKKLYGSLLRVDKTKDSFFKNGEFEFTVPPHVGMYQVINFICIYQKQKKITSIAVASVFVKKNDAKILGCDFLIPEKETLNDIRSNTPDLSELRGSKREKPKSIFEFEIEMQEGVPTECNVEASENDVIGFNCPDMFASSPYRCFDSVKIMGSSSKEEVVKISKLIEGVKVFYNDKFADNTTPTYVILPSRIPKSSAFFCTCNSLTNVTKGTININIMGEDQKKLFKKHIKLARHVYQRQEYEYDFTTGNLNISPHNVLERGNGGSGESSTQRNDGTITTMSVDSDSGLDNYQHTGKYMRGSGKKKEFLKLMHAEDDSDPAEDLEDHDPQEKEPDIKNDTRVVAEPKTNGEVAIDSDDIDDQDEDGVNHRLLNCLRTKKIIELDLILSEFGKLKIVCPLRDSLEFSQIKLAPANFFEYVYVFNKSKKQHSEPGEATEKEGADDFCESVSLPFADTAIDNESTEDTDNTSSDEKPTAKPNMSVDESGNILFVFEQKKDAPLPGKSLQPVKKKEEEEEEEGYLIIKNIDDVVSFVDHKTEIVEDKYVSVLTVSPVVLQDASFFITCDNSLTLYNQNRGKAALVRVRIKSNNLKILGCDFTNTYDSFFYYSARWEDISDAYTCHITAENDSIIGIACPAHTKLLPNNCFEMVLDNGKAVNGDTFFKKKHAFFFNKPGKDILSFVQIESASSVTFGCNCYTTNVGETKEVSMQVTFEEYVPGTQKQILDKSFYNYL